METVFTSGKSWHVVRRQPPIAPENKYCKRKGKKDWAKVNFFLVRAKTNWSLVLSLFWFYKLSNFATSDCSIVGKAKLPLSFIFLFIVDRIKVKIQYSIKRKKSQKFSI